MTGPHAFLGLGAMGSAMASSLAARGGLENPLIAWNRTESKATAVAELPAVQAGSGAEVAKSHIDAIDRTRVVWSCLATQEIAEQIWFDAAENADLKGKVVVDSTTMGSAGVKEIARRIEEAGGHFVSMPVVGPPELARIGKLICITSGKTEAVQQVKPFIECVLARVQIDLSGSPIETAQKLKLCQNLFSLTVTQQLAEFYTLAEKSGIGAGSGHKLIEALFPDSPHHLFYSKRMLSGSCFDTEGIVSPALVKEVAGHVNAMADEYGVKLQSYNVAVDNLDVVDDRGDFTAIYGAVREQSGLPFSTKE